jgi:hypothetical protein
VVSPHQSRVVHARRLVAGLAALAMALPPAPASAQGLFEFFFGGGRRPWNSPSASPYAEPQAPPADQAPRVSAGAVFCVRLCDGRYFPLQRVSGANAAQACSSFCPAARTKIYSGGAIDHAVAPDGARYKDLPSAFAYRDRTVAGCTCNGQDPYGLVTTDVRNDPTLRTGDIVATEQGFFAYSGGGSGWDGGARGADGRRGEFTPIESYGGLSAELRGRLAGAKIVPRDTTMVAEPEHTAGAGAISPTDSPRPLRRSTATR